MLFAVPTFNTSVCKQFIKCGGGQRILDLLLQFGQFAVNGAVSAFLAFKIPKQTPVHINFALNYVNNVP
jgi:hypothetical protein